MKFNEYIENHILRCEASYGGGGIEIDCSELFPYIEEAGMTAYQNYLGGGMLGAIQSSNNFESELRKKTARSLKRCARHYKLPNLFTAKEESPGEKFAKFIDGLFEFLLSFFRSPVYDDHPK